MGGLASVWAMAEEFERTQEMEKEVSGINYPTTLETMHALACSWHGLGRYEIVETLMSEVVESKRRVLGSTPPDTFLAVRMLARWQEERRRREFEENTARIFEKLQAGLAPKTVDALEAISSLAAMRCWQGRYQQAAALDNNPFIQQRTPAHRPPHHSINNEKTRIILL